LVERSFNLFARTKKRYLIRSKFQESLWPVENVVPEYEYMKPKCTVENIPSWKKRWVRAKYCWWMTRR
jgi:hypothetical protein